MTASIASCLDKHRELAEVSQSSRLDLELLLAAALGKSRTYLRTDADALLSPAQEQHFNALFQRRLAGEPIAYILQSQEFWSMEFKVTPDVLIPRADTETLVDAALQFLDSRPDAKTVLELGTGSGCISIALKSERPELCVTASDLSAAALAIARSNAEKLLNGRAICFVQSDWFDSINDRYDLIISNPPYIPYDDPHLAALGFEPESALVAADSGLACLLTIIQQSKAHLKDNGMLLLEHGYDQGPAIVDKLHESAYQRIRPHYDLANIHRATSAAV